MKTLLDCILSNNGLAFGVGTLIFFITIVLIATRLIGFGISLLLLVFALAASLSIANQDIIRNYLQAHTEKTPIAPEAKSKIASLQEQIMRAHKAYNAVGQTEDLDQENP